MGIPSYFAHILRNHKKILSKLNKLNNNNTQIHNFYLDCNSIIYDMVRNVEYTNIDKYEKTIVEEVCKKIEHYIKTINPCNNVYIAFDGVPPVAKLSQQKNRRYKNWYQNNIFDISNKWDTTNITPGTRFMTYLDDYVKKYFKNSKNNFGVKNIVVSGSIEPGEGEHKIYKYIRDNETAHKEHNTVIYGLDADLIMLSLNHLSYCNNIYLYREAPHFISNIDNSLSSNEEYIIDMDMFRNELYKLMVNTFEINKSRDQCIKDYIFMCFLLGNDFLPHFPAINIRHSGIDQLLQLYKMLYGNNNKTFIKNGKICWRNLKTFINHIGDNEEELLLNIYKIRNKLEKKNWPEGNFDEKFEKFMNVPTQNRNIEKFINPYENNWRWRYYKSIFNIDIDGNDNKDNQFIKKLSLNYIETLEWTYKYYTIGCQDWQFCYQYSYPPLFQDLFNYIPYFDNEMISTKNMEPLNVNTTLAYVLPYNCLYLLDEPFKKYLLENWGDYYREDYHFEWAFCRYYWECHVKFSEINIDTFNNSIVNYINNYIK
tara:strand:+ start:10314 stop:11933 length:1620 start_codon:yes stop_codon:yes gene_type:complete